MKFFCFSNIFDKLLMKEIFFKFNFGVFQLLNTYFSFYYFGKDKYRNQFVFTVSNKS